MKRCYACDGCQAWVERRVQLASQVGNLPITDPKYIAACEELNGEQYACTKNKQA